MIFIALINTIYAIVYLVSSPFLLLPEVTLPSGYLSSITSASSYITPINTIIPLDTLLNIFYLFIGIEVAYFTFKGIMWLVKRFPTQS